MHSPSLPPTTLIAIVLAASASGAELFVDVGAEAGIRFKHEVGFAQAHRHLFETMAGGAAWLDYDGDGRLDLYIVQAHADASSADKPGAQGNVLYRNLGNGRFEDVTDLAGVGDRHYGQGAAVGDIDNDGDPDLYVTNYGRNTLYLNNGDGTFTDITESAGVACPVWSSSAAFADLDGDGILDLYVANYVDYRLGTHEGCTGNRLKIRSYCHPNKFRGIPDTLYRGLGNGRFHDVTRSAGIGRAGMFEGKGLGVLPTDFDGDGDVDLIVPCDSVPDILWRNLGGMKFEDAALEVGIALSPDGKALAGMGVDGGDVNGDGFLDFTVTNFAKESNSLFLGTRDGYFDPVAAANGVSAATFLPLGFGCKLFDHDLDGDLDLYYTCGHVSAAVETLYPSSGESFEQTDLLLENDGRGRFTDISKRSGRWFERRLVGRGAAFADYDDDGDTDVFIVNMNGPGVLLRNNCANSKGWIGFDLEGDGKGSSRDAYGARVTVVSAAGIRRVFERRAAASYQSSNDPRVVCGLGSETAVREVEIRWPDGERQTVKQPATGRYHRIVRR